MKKLLLIGVYIILILIPIGIWMQIQSRENGEKNFTQFNSAEINSFIKTVEIVSKGTGIKLADGREFVFYPYTDKELNNSNIFNHVAKQGDRIIKPSYSDTLLLITPKGNLKYTFKKFNY